MEQYKGKEYHNKKTKRLVGVVDKRDGLLKIRYIQSKFEVWYTTEFFEDTFEEVIPVIAFPL